MIKKLKTFVTLEPQLKLMVLQAIVLSVYTGVLFAFFSRHVKFGPRADERRNQQQPDPTAYNIARAIKIAVKYIFWKNVCRHQAYQAKLLCNYYKVPCLIFIGFKKDKEKNEIQAHAWTIAGGKIITGFCNPEEYTVQSIYKNKWQ